MKRIALLIFLFCGSMITAQAQSPDAETHRAIRTSIQNYAWSTPTAWMENYAWLQQQEMPWFARDTFTMTWTMDPNNLIVLPDDRPGQAWTAIFDPTWVNGSRQPVPERHELRGKSCQSIAGPAHYIEDIGFVFTLDSNLKVLDANPLVDVRENGFFRRLSDDELEGVDCSECIRYTFRGEEANKRYLVGQHHRAVLKMKQWINANPHRVRQMLDRAVREAYPGFRILTIEACNMSERACWFRGDGLSHSISTYGKITAATGPKELNFEAVFHFPEGEDPSVDEVRVFK